MKIKNVELRIIRLPLVRPFRTSFGTQLERELLLVKITTQEGVEGWAECVAMSEPLYSPEYTMGSQDVMERFLLPKIFASKFSTTRLSNLPQWRSRLSAATPGMMPRIPAT